MTNRQFNAIEALFDRLHNEAYSGAQGDDGEDMRRRRVEYRKKLERMLRKHSMKR